MQLVLKHQRPEVAFIATHDAVKPLSLDLYLTTVQAGFPSPANDYLDKRLDLNELLIEHDAATFYCRVSGDSMIDAGIYDGDMLIVDRAEKARQSSVVIANVDGELTCKILDIKNCRLLPSNDKYSPIEIKGDIELTIEGVVIHSIRSHVRTG